MLALEIVDMTLAFAMTLTSPGRTQFAFVFYLVSAIVNMFVVILLAMDVPENANIEHTWNLLKKIYKKNVSNVDITKSMFELEHEIFNPICTKPVTDDEEKDNVTTFVDNPTAAGYGDIAVCIAIDNGDENGNLQGTHMHTYTPIHAYIHILYITGDDNEKKLDHAEPPLSTLDTLDPTTIDSTCPHDPTNSGRFESNPISPPIAPIAPTRLVSLSSDSEFSLSSRKTTAANSDKNSIINSTSSSIVKSSDLSTEAALKMKRAKKVCREFEDKVEEYVEQLKKRRGFCMLFMISDLLDASVVLYNLSTFCYRGEGNFYIDFYTLMAMFALLVNVYDIYQFGFSHCKKKVQPYTALALRCYEKQILQKEERWKKMDTAWAMKVRCDVYVNRLSSKSPVITQRHSFNSQRIALLRNNIDNEIHELQKKIDKSEFDCVTGRLKKLASKFLVPSKFPQNVYKN